MMMGRYFSFMHLAGCHRSIRKQFTLTTLVAIFVLCLYYTSFDQTRKSTIVPRQVPIVTNVDLTVIKTQINISGRDFDPKTDLNRSNDSRRNRDAKKSGLKSKLEQAEKRDLVSEYWGCVEERVQIGIGSYEDVTLTQEQLCPDDPPTQQHGYDDNSNGKKNDDNNNRYTNNQSPNGRHEGITLFTTMHEKNASLLFIFNNTLHTWAKLRPFVRPVLFMSRAYRHGPLVQEACKLGWDVFALPLCNQDEYPVLKAMFQVAQNVHNSTWYGYANGDVLFSPHLATALTFMEQHTNVSQHSLLTGRRKDIHLSPEQKIRTEEDLEILSSLGKMHGPYGLDYFITHADGFRWTDILPFVVGATRFDNWLLWYAIRQKDVYDIKATRAILPLHQEIGTSAPVPHTDDFNRLLIDVGGTGGLSQGFKVTYGNTGCMHHVLVPISEAPGYKLYGRHSKPDYCDPLS